MAASEVPPRGHQALGDLLEFVFGLDAKLGPMPADPKQQMRGLLAWLLETDVAALEALAREPVTEHAGWPPLRIKQLLGAARLLAADSSVTDLAMCVAECYPNSRQGNELHVVLQHVAVFESIVELLTGIEPAKAEALMACRSADLEAFGLLTVVQLGATLTLRIHALAPRRAVIGGHTWRAAPALCEFFIANNFLHGKRVIELGTGTGLCGITAAKLGAKAVVLTDYVPAIVSNARFNAKLNSCGESVSACHLDWRAVAQQGSAGELTAGFDVVIASDCIYEEEHAELVPLVASLLMRKNPSARFFAASPAPVNGREQRAGIEAFPRALAALGFACSRHELIAGQARFVVTECWLHSS